MIDYFIFLFSMMWIFGGLFSHENEQHSKRNCLKTKFFNTDYQIFDEINISLHQNEFILN